MLYHIIIVSHMSTRTRMFMGRSKDLLRLPTLRFSKGWVRKDQNLVVCSGFGLDRSVYIGFRLFVPPETRLGGFSSII